jgi:hypothetical protein
MASRRSSRRAAVGHPPQPQHRAPPPSYRCRGGSCACRRLHQAGTIDAGGGLRPTDRARRSFRHRPGRAPAHRRRQMLPNIEPIGETGNGRPHPPLRLSRSGSIRLRPSSSGARSNRSPAGHAMGGCDDRHQTSGRARRHRDEPPGPRPSRPQVDGEALSEQKLRLQPGSSAGAAWRPASPRTTPRAPAKPSQ